MATARRGKDQQAIRDLDAAWGDAASKHDVDAVVAFYATNGTLVWPGMKAVHGAAAIRRAWKKMVAETPGLALEFIADDITVSKDGDLAADFGRVILIMDDKDGKKVRSVAKYVVTWQKVRGTWKVLYDSWNENTSGS